MSKALGTNAAMPAPSGVSYRGRWGLVRYGPFALPSYHFGRGTMAARRFLLILLVVATGVFAAMTVAFSVQGRSYRRASGLSTLVPCPPFVSEAIDTGIEEGTGQHRQHDSRSAVIGFSED